MMIFLSIAAGLIVLALAFVVPTLWQKNSKVGDIDPNRMNIAIYKERLAELEQDNLTPEQRTQAQQELDKTLAQDLDDTTKPSIQPPVRWASIVVAICLPALTIGWYWKLGTWHLLAPGQSSEAPQVAHQQKVPSDFDEMVKKLVVRLQEQPDDDKGWRMLARSYTFLKRYSDAVHAYNKLLAIVGEQEPQLLTDLASVLVLSNDGQFSGQPTILLKRVLELEPDHQEALWLSGLAAVQKEEYNAAIRHWQRLLPQIPSSELETREMLETHIAEARRQLAQNDIAAQVVEPAPAIMPIDKNDASSPSNVTQIEVHVSLAPALQKQVKSGDSLFIYARAITGSAMPLAIIKKSASELPITVVLDDSMAMIPSMKLSHFEEVMIFARISSSGAAMVQSGDLQGQINSVIFAQQDKVAVTINQVVP